MSRRRLACVLAALSLLVQAGVALADEPYRITILQLDPSDFPSVRIVAAVTDAQGRPVKGLTPADLVVREEGAAQPAKVELASRTSPLALALVLDTSGSMAGQPMLDAKRAIASMIQSLTPADRAALITFSEKVRVAQPLTVDKEALVAATNAAAAGGNTSINDAIVVAADLLGEADAQARRAIVLLTDGVDTTSATSRDAAVSRVAAAGHAVYVVGLGRSLDLPALEALAAASQGGRVFVAPTSAQLATVYASLSQQILTQYSIRYQSTRLSLADGGRVSVDLQLLRDQVALGETATSFLVPSGHGARTQEPIQPPIPQGEPAAPAARPDDARVVVGPELVGLLGAATTLITLLWLSELAYRDAGRQRRRVEMFVRGLSPTARAQGPRRPLAERVFIPLVRTVGRRFLRLTPASVTASTRERLEQAGGPFNLGAAEFIGLRFGIAILGAIASVTLLALGDGRPGLILGGGVAGMTLGYAVPGFVLGGIARARKNAIQRALPASLDMLALSAEAGLAFDGAIAQVAMRWKNPLSDEFRRLLVEFQMGRERREALRGLARRTGVADVARFANAVVQADTMGLGLSKVLQEQAVEMRTKRRHRAEELARTAPVKMLFPMILLIFPALFVVILGPAFIRVLAIFTLAR